jgi:succinate-semialdehyde dehydrogenase/glutarate-semialdehyde dehydrogenase
LTDLTKDMRVVKEEVFGPIAPMIKARSEEEMIRIANETELGLGAAVWTSDISRAERLAREIDSGFIAINGVVKSDTRLPFGGVKKSGIGRELSHYGLKEFVNVKTIMVGR